MLQHEFSLLETLASNHLPGEGQSLIEGVLFRAEVVHYKHQLKSGKCCSWHQYLNGLKQDRPQWDEVVAAYHDALARLDFKPVWRSERLEELAKQAETGGVK